MPLNTNLPIPAPAGTNANGEPYWIINGQQITWAQMQQLIWQQMQKQQAGATAKGVEQIPNLPIIDDILNAVTKPDMAVESGSNLKPEKAESRIEKPTQTANQDAIATTKKEEAKPAKPKGASVAGDTHRGATAAIFSDVEEMYKFYEQNKQKIRNPDPEKADDFLVVVVERFLKMMSAKSA